MSMSAMKLASLLVRTVSKPIANSMKNYGKNHATFRQLCINIAQVTYRLEIKLNMKLLGQKSEKIRPLNEAKAVDMGANFLGEAIIFGVASSLIIWEQARSYKSSKDRQHQLDGKIEMLEEETSKLRALIEINGAFEDKMMNQIENLKNDNEKLQNLLDTLLTKELESRRPHNLGFPKMQWESKNDNKNPLERDLLDKPPPSS